MNVFVKTIFILVAGVFGATALAADFDGSKTLMCSLAQITECDAGSECRGVTNENVDAPDFVKLNFKKKQVVAISAGVESEPGEIDNVIDLANYIVVQGVQGGAENSADALAWSVTINHESGHMTFAAAGEKAVFVVFGACTTT
jgi:hypothetical protein